MEYGRERVIKASVMPPVFFLNDWKKGGSILLAVKWKSVCGGACASRYMHDAFEVSLERAVAK